jgi:hypothetical protein
MDGGEQPEVLQGRVNIFASLTTGDCDLRRGTPVEDRSLTTRFIVAISLE